MSATDRPAMYVSPELERRIYESVPVGKNRFEWVLKFEDSTAPRRVVRANVLNVALGVAVNLKLKDARLKSLAAERVKLGFKSVADSLYSGQLLERLVATNEGLRDELRQHSEHLRTLLAAEPSATWKKRAADFLKRTAVHAEHA